MSQLFFHRLSQRCQEAQTLLCVGLDPRVTLAPQAEVSEAVQQIVEMNRRIIDATSPYAAAFKPNIAFYEAFGIPGLEALKITLELIPEEIPVILDAKRGDIGATARAYAQAVFEDLDVEAVTLSPYMGSDSAEPFLDYKDRGAFFLCKTSNPGSRDFQTLENCKGTPLYLQVADRVLTWGAGEGQCGLVVGGNDIPALRAVRERHPGAWILAPGIGAQGGSIEDCIRWGARKDGMGILPVVARGIAQAENPGETAKWYRDQLNEARRTVQSPGSSLQSPQQGSAIEDSEPTLSEDDHLRRRVLRGLVDNQCFRTGEFTLKSGEKSPFYIDLRLIMSSPELLAVTAKAYASLLDRASLRGYSFDRIAGIPAAGLPLATAVSLETGIPMIFPRLNVKSHGTGRFIEGAYNEGERVLLLDDLITSGKSKIEALEVLRQAGLRVDHLVVLLERGTQGRKDMQAAGITLEAFAHVNEFFPLLEDLGVLSAEQRRSMEEFANR